MDSLERDHVPRSRPLAVKETQLIDRTEEMRLLREAADRAVRGEGGVVFLCGEAGIGKTRLTRELGAYARLSGMQVLYGRCPALFRMDGVPPYVLWSEVIKDYLHSCTPEQLYKVIGLYPGELFKLVPDIKQRLKVFSESSPISPECGRDRLFEAVSQFVTNISKEAPLLVILDDLQWTDQTSLLLLHYLARGVYREPLLLLGAYRDTDVDEKHPLTPVLTELNRERLLQSAQLKRMSFDDASEMIKRILEQDDVSREFCELIYEKTRGNPFFAEEVTKSLKEEGVIYRTENRWGIKDVSKIEFPKTVKSVIKARIGRLDDECQNVLTLASFIGNDFTLEAMCAVAGVEESKLLELMDKMFKTGLIEERVIRGEGICSFADILVRDVVYEEVSPLKRKKLHGIVGCALEKVYAKKIDEHVGELASHFLESGDRDRALDYFLKAGVKAAKIYANVEAASYYQSALRLLEEKESGIPEKANVLEMLGDVKNFVGEYDACIKFWNDALVLWRKVDEKEKAARLHRKAAVILWHELGNTEKARENFDIALKILETQPENAELATLYSDKARMSYFTEDVAEAVSWAQKALELAKKLDAFEVIASSYINLALVFSSTGDWKKAVECLEKALKIALDNGYLDTALRAYNNLANALPAGENERILDLFEKGFELSRKVGHIKWISWFGTVLSGMSIGMGNMNKALLLAEESEKLSRKAGDLANLELSKENTGLIYHILGEWDKGEEYVKEAFALSLKLNNTQSIWRSCAYLGWSYYDRGEYAKAKECWEKGYETIEKAGAKSLQIYASLWVASTWLELGEIEKANNLIDKSLDFALEKDDKQLLADAHCMRARSFRVEKKWNESIEFFEKGLREYEALGARRWNVYFFAKWVLVEYARVYLDRDQEGDREKTGKLLNQALEIFQKMGAKKDIEKVEAGMIYVETGQVPPAPKPMGQIATGYSDLDKLLHGGIPANYAVALTSPSCDERDLLIESFLEAGAKNGEVTFYVTIDPSAARDLTKEPSSTFYLFLCNPQADAIVKSSPNIFTLKGVENLTDISIALTSAIRKLDPSLKGPRRIFIGLISDVLLQHHAVQTRKWLTALTAELKSNGFTTLVTINPQMHPSQELQAILDLFEGEVNIYEKETEKGSGKFLKIKRMSNHKYLENELPLKKEELN